MSIQFGAYVRYGYYYDNEALRDLEDEDENFFLLLQKWNCTLAPTDPMGDDHHYVLYHNDLEFGVRDIESVSEDNVMGLPTALPDVESGNHMRLGLRKIKEYLSDKGIKPHPKGNKLAWQFTVEIS